MSLTPKDAGKKVTVTAGYLQTVADRLKIHAGHMMTGGEETRREISGKLRDISGELETAIKQQI